VSTGFLQTNNQLFVASSWRVGLVVVKVEYSRGFTLIEVLFVLLMTSLLVAAVLPWEAVQDAVREAYQAEDTDRL
jgi:prepilin-type N-terminal cleavage/methylation domain-containing protein